MPSPWKLDVKRRAAALAAGLARAPGVPAVDLYQIHGPISLRSHAALAEALAGGAPGRPGEGRGRVELLGEGDAGHRRRAAQAAACASPPTRSSSRCCAARPRPAACSPPAPSSAWCRSPTRPSGRGGSPASTPPPTRRPASGTSPTTRWRWSTASSPSCARSARSTAARPPSQVALNWIIAKGAVPIPGAKNRAQADENAGALGWSVDADDLAALDAGRAARPPRPRQPRLAARLTHRRRHAFDFWGRICAPGAADPSREVQGAAGALVLLGGAVVAEGLVAAPGGPGSGPWAAPPR